MAKMASPPDSRRRPNYSSSPPAIRPTLFDAPVYRNYGAVLLKERYRPAGFAAPLGLKDMRLAAESSETLRVPMPLLSLLRDRLLETIAIDGPDTDWSTIARASSRAAGLIR